MQVILNLFFTSFHILCKSHLNNKNIKNGLKYYVDSDI